MKRAILARKPAVLRRGLPLPRSAKSLKNFDTFCHAGYNHGMEGYHGRYLHIDLCRPSGEFLCLASALLRSFLGGSGLGAALLLRHGSAECEPLSPAATIAFVFSSLVGSPLTTSAKFAVVSKSPLTQRINDSLAS